MIGGALWTAAWLPGALMAVAVQLGLGVLGLAFARAPAPHARVVGALIYAFCCLLACALLVGAAAHLATGRPAEAWVLPIGLPWLGAHLRRDPRGCHADDDGVVARQHHIDDDDLQECNQLRVKRFHEVLRVLLRQRG